MCGKRDAKQYAYLAGAGWDWMRWMHDFMGFFVVVFSMFKFFNMEGFADGFQMYDLLAKPFQPYAYVYPFIELALGLGYLAAGDLHRDHRRGCQQYQRRSAKECH